MVADKGETPAVPEAMRIPAPSRSLIFERNRRGAPLGATTLKKWVVLAKTVQKAAKADFLLSGEDTEPLRGLLDFAETQGLALSLRVADTVHAWPDLPDLAGKGLLDLCLSPVTPGSPAAREWAGAARRAGLPLRARIFRPSPEDIPWIAETFADASLISIVWHDPFLPPAGPCPVPPAGLGAVAAGLERLGLPVVLEGMPFCRAECPEALVQNTPQFFADFRQYMLPGHDLAVKLHRLGPNRIDKVLENLLARRTSVHTGIDASLFPWLMDYPRCYIRVWMWHKFTRHFRFLRFLRRGPRPLNENTAAWEEELGRYRERLARTMGPECARCAFRLQCDHHTGEFRAAWPGVGVAAVDGPVRPARPVAGALEALRPDRVDLACAGDHQGIARRAEEALHIITREQPTRELSTDNIEIEGRYTHHMPGAIRWLSFMPCELQSTVLARLEPPFTLTLTVGGGIAGHVGFSFGRFAKIVCPMVDYSHRITLHVAADGGYVLLRDGQPVRPAEFQGERSLPPRLAGVLEPRISLHNIDGMILTQTLLLWEGAGGAPKPAPGVKYSVIIISTRYTRRLQAALLALAHQRGVPPGLFEVVVGYVPGIDATDDLLDGLRDAFPDLRIVRSPFGAGCERAKGFMINESLQAASGEWILLMDADIVVPPDTFAELEKATGDDVSFVAPDGRKMLTPEVTSKILLGEIRPWECHGELVNGPGEIRHREADGIPIGFFQCVRRDILKRIRYHELDHFEASDWVFGRDVVVRYGMEVRLRDFNVLHLDHSGSQWYGTSKHR